MTPTIEQIKEILAGAPDGATHYIETEFSTFYLKDDDTGFYVYENNQWKRDYVEDFGVTESLLPLRTILAQHEEIERLHSLIIGLINCGDSLISTKGKPHFEDYAYADWKDARTKANATLAASLTREQSK